MLVGWERQSREKDLPAFVKNVMIALPKYSGERSE
jgi:hypothetical protein